MSDGAGEPLLLGSWFNSTLNPERLIGNETLNMMGCSNAASGRYRLPALSLGLPQVPHA